MSPRSASVPRTMPVHPLGSPDISTSRSASPLSNPSPSVMRFERLRLWWNNLRTPRSLATYFDAKVVQPNDTRICCPNNEATIWINATSSSGGPGKPIHASHFKIERTVPKSTTTDEIRKSSTYRIGQSPPKETCMDFLVAGLESGLGLFQFVSERTHTKNTSRSNTAVVQLLEKKTEGDCGRQRP